MSQSNKGPVRLGAIAAAETMVVLGPAQVLYQVGGKNLLTEGAQQALKTVAEKGAFTAIDHIAKASSNTVARQAVIQAGREVGKGIGRASGIGFVLDGLVATAHASNKVRKGEFTSKQALQHIGQEASTGALATASGVAASAALVALTGGMAVPALVAVSASTAILTKLGLTRLVR
jgi:hypothetical protein